MNKNLLGGEGEKERREKNKKISTLLLIMEVDFCPVLCIAKMPILHNVINFSKEQKS
jgi:hypothetical protein